MLLQWTLSSVLSQSKLASECGFESIIPRMWVGPVNSMDPQGRQFIGWDGLWMEEASGISLDSLVFGRGFNPSTNRSEYLDRYIVSNLLFEKCGTCIS
jgi:hypothetical protein